jgi:hypothetical protein
VPARNVHIHHRLRTQLAQVRLIPVVGEAGTGKSHLLNILLAGTEVDKRAYNYGRMHSEWCDDADPGAYHAARIAAMLVHRDIADETKDFNDIVAECVGVGAEKWLEDNGARRCMMSDNDRVIHELPSEKIFDRHGCLNPAFVDVGASGLAAPYVMHTLTLIGPLRFAMLQTALYSLSFSRCFCISCYRVKQRVLCFVSPLRARMLKY